MRVVMSVALPEVLRLRKQTGADRFDEMWEGVLHMTAAPRVDHQDAATGIASFFRDVWTPRSGGLALVQANVSTPERWDRDYRIPDVSVVAADRLPRPEDLFVRPAVVVEVRSPDDDSFEKLPFYAAVGVDAVVVVERDTRAVQVLALSSGSFVLVPPAQDGWLVVERVGVELRCVESETGRRLALRLRGEPATERLV
jgi:Uma2 family endonuclease